MRNSEGATDNSKSSKEVKKRKQKTEKTDNPRFNSRS
jgi:hypothetical protein